MNKEATALLVDDELQYLDWLVEYLEAKSLKVESVSNLDDAVTRLTADRYRLAVIDLNIPAGAELRALLSEQEAAYGKYPGAYAALVARNMGHRARQIVVYSVHESDEVANLSNRIGFAYITKGRPYIIKQELDQILSYDPTRRDR